MKKPAYTFPLERGKATVTIRLGDTILVQASVPVDQLLTVVPKKLEQAINLAKRQGSLSLAGELTQEKSDNQKCVRQSVPVVYNGESLSLVVEVTT